MWSLASEEPALPVVPEEKRMLEVASDGSITG